jgi:DNA helicase IV
MPLIENFATETDYQAVALYEINLQRYHIHSSQIEEMLSQGKAQILVDVSNRKPELCYRLIPETRTKQREEEDTVEKLREQDRLYRSYLNKY